MLHSVPPAAIAAATYALLYGALGALLPFLPVVLAQRGLNGTEIGAVLVTLPVCALVTPPLWGALADLWQSRVRVFVLASLACAASIWMLRTAATTASVAVTLVAVGIFMAPLSALADAVTRTLLEADPTQYGRVRMWGSLGFVLAAYGSGELGGADAPGLVLGVAAGCQGGAALFAALLPDHARRTPRLPAAQLRGLLVAAVAEPATLTLLLAVGLYYTGHAINDAFISLHLEEHGLDARSVGMAWAIGVIVEIGIMFAGPNILARHRARTLFILCTGAAVVRWLGMAWLTHPTLLIALQGLHGLTFGLWYLVLVDTMQQRSPEALRGSMQSFIVTAVAAGRVLGYLGGGWAWDVVGPSPMYLGAAVLTAASVFLFVAATRRAQGPAPLLSSSEPA